MGVFGTACPPAFYQNSRELVVIRRLKDALGPADGPPPDWTRLMAVFDAESVQIMRRHMAEHAAETYRTFPGLTVFPSNMTYREKLDAIRSSSLLTGELKRFNRLRGLLLAAEKTLPQGLSPLEWRRTWSLNQDKALLAAYSKQYGLNGDFEELQRVSHQSVRNTHGYLDQLLEYIPIPHRKQLECAACVRAARDFPTLIHLSGNVSGTGVISKRIAFEARMVAVLAQLEFEYLIGAYNPERVDSIREQLISVFENQVFDPSLSRRLVVVAELDPHKDNRVKRDGAGTPVMAVYDETQPEACQMATGTRLVLPLDVRLVRHGETMVPVFFDTRRKEMIFAKLLRKLYREPEHITDHSGFTLVFFSNGPEIEIVANRLRDEIVTNPGQVWAQMSNAARAGAVDANNPHSSVDRRAEKYNFRWGGITHELQLLDLATYVDSLVCRNRLAHVVYKFLTLVDTTFPFIWPHAIYGKDWLDGEFRDLLWRYMLGRLWTGPESGPCEACPSSRQT